MNLTIVYGIFRDEAHTFTHSTDILTKGMNSFFKINSLVGIFFCFDWSENRYLRHGVSILPAVHALKITFGVF